MDNQEYINLHDYKVWEVKDINDLEWNNIATDGYGYVIMSDGSRYDSPHDEALYREERLKWNKIKGNCFSSKEDFPELDQNIKTGLINFFSSTNILIEEKIIRSSKYSADIAEYLCAKLFGLTLCDNQREVGYDALDLNGNKIQIKINNSAKKTNQDIGNKAAYDYLYLVITSNSLMYNSVYNTAFFLFYIIPSGNLPVEKYIAKNFIKSLKPAIALSDKFEII